jgi:hypothetical protein
MRLKILLTAVVWLTSLNWAGAQAPTPPQPPETPAQIVEGIRVLRVARTLNLRAEQVQQIQPLLTSVQETLQQEKLTLDALWEQAAEAMEVVCAAWEIGDPAPAKELDTANRASQAYYRTLRAVDDKVATRAEELARLLDAGQRALIETAAQRDAAEGAAGGGGVAADIARTLSVLRFVQPDEYRLLRLAVALKLGEYVLAPDHRDYNAVVREIMRLADTVRRMSDAQYATQEPQLAATVARALRLSAPAPPEPVPIPLNEYLLFMSSPLTSELLKTYVPAVTAAGGGQ